MGLDAYVVCNCVKEGKVKPPPFDSGLLEWTEEGIDLSDSGDDEIYRLFLRWREQACEHEDFYYYYDRVANTAGGNFFYGAMDRLGIGYFPLLSSIGGKPLPANQADKALKELDILESMIRELQGTFLVEPESLEEYKKALAGEDSWFYASGGQLTYRLNERGFCIIHGANGELFRSVAFTQEVIRGESVSREHPLVRFHDTETGRVHECDHPFRKKIWGVEELYYPSSLQVVTRELKSSDFPSAGVLRKLFEASMQTGNPIIWT
ncbi:hypothetical protein DFP94_102197 [Fontibacillus phaseoli]|uniref:Uncharacterized protein n=1 Tax=Fontibacillus phaseoli TaxID=1416533 RepID=A0A369BP48_9BACL|nr:hypothetical protein [Fontibacillus phaseoli]RCX21444.1 hypothetical protein DFP94_102197 [Fontibacillus phaseoli]